MQKTTEPADVGVMIALREEVDELFDQICKGLLLADDGYYLFERPAGDGRPPCRCVATFIGEIDDAKCTLHTERMLERWRPSTVVMLGIAGGLHKDVKAGDVVAATQVDSYIASARAVPAGDGGTFEFCFGGQVYHSTNELLVSLRHLPYQYRDLYERWVRWGKDDLSELVRGPVRERLIGSGLLAFEPKFRDGHLATGPILGAAKEFIHWIHSRDRNLLALDMESGGLMRAAHARREPVRSLVLRGISDLADDRKKELDDIGEGALRRYAMRNAIRLLWTLIETGALSRSASVGASMEASSPIGNDAATGGMRSAPERECHDDGRIKEHVRFILKLDAHFDQFTQQKAEAIVAEYLSLAQRSGLAITLRIMEIRPGSVQLILQGSPEAYRIIENLFRSGQVREVLGVPILGVYFEEHPRMANARISDRMRARALLIGVGEYLDPCLRHLRTPAQDARDLRDLLVDPRCGGYPAENVMLLLERQATRETILRELDNLVQASNEPSTILFFFSGHGDITSAGQWLLPVDAAYNAKLLVEESAISDSELTDRLRKIEAPKLLVILDCCHAGGMGQAKSASSAAQPMQEWMARLFTMMMGQAKGGPPMAASPLREPTAAYYRRELSEGRGRVFLAACSSDEKAYEYERRNSVFTTHLLDGLRGKAADSDGLVRVLDLLKHLERQVRADHGLQMPVFGAYQSTNFAIAMGRSGVSAPVHPIAAPDHPGGGARVASTPLAATQHAQGQIFISYSQQDSAVADEIATALQDIGLTPWLDREQIQPGQSFIQRINEGLQAASYLLLLASPASLASRSVAREWMSTLARNGTVVIPVKIAPCDLPPLLSDLLAIDLTAGRQRGLSRLIEFFRKELSPAVLPGSTVDEGTRDVPPDFVPLLEGATRREIRLVAMGCLDEVRFKSFLHDAALAEGRIGGNSLHERIVNLLHVIGSEGLLRHFTDWLVLECERCVAHQLNVLSGQRRWEI